MRLPFRLFAGVLLLTPLAPSATPLFNEVVSARDLICELRAEHATGFHSLVLIIENVSAGSRVARLVSSLGTGSRPVRVYSGDTGVHFVEDIGASVKVTTLMSCMIWQDSNKGRKCARYEAVNRWHFDTSAHRKPDESFLKLSRNSFSGWCEPWRMD